MPHRTPAKVPSHTAETLTNRETGVAQLVAAGLSNREVAARLAISERTVENHMARVYAKLGVRSRAKLARVVLDPSSEGTQAAGRIMRSLESYRTGISLLQSDYRQDDAGALLTSIRAGLKPGVWSQLRRLGFTTPEIASVVGVNERTISRKENRGEPLDVVEGDRTMRLAQIALEAARAFGDLDKAMRWLRKANRVLGGEKPIEVITTEPGTVLVRRALGMIEYGGVA